MDSKEIIDFSTAIPAVKSYLQDLQNRICQCLEAEDQTKTFISEPWQYASGGGGVSRILEQGTVIEKAGVNFSHIEGKMLPQAASARQPELAGASFQALGVSVVVHPQNPYVPTTHMNVRLIVTKKNNQEISWWFGGGFDLSPYYGFNEDCLHWHRQAKAACDPFGADWYARYKAGCDQYFYLAHRNEPRGIGGIFYDDLTTGGFEHCFAFMRSVGDHFIAAYQPIVARRKTMPFEQRQRDFQLYRRGRYVEFNLLYDRGTLFGLQSGGRTESILMSLPPLVSWKYNWQPEEGTEEARLYREFLVRKEWI